MCNRNPTTAVMKRNTPNEHLKVKSAQHLSGLWHLGPFSHALQPIAEKRLRRDQLARLRNTQLKRWRERRVSITRQPRHGRIHHRLNENCRRHRHRCRPTAGPSPSAGNALRLAPLAPNLGLTKWSSFPIISRRAVAPGRRMLPFASGQATAAWARHNKDVSCSMANRSL